MPLPPLARSPFFLLSPRSLSAMSITNHSPAGLKPASLCRDFCFLPDNHLLHAVHCLVTGLEEKVPSRIRNSPMNPLSNGSPRLESEMIRNIVEYRGIGVATPPNSSINRVCRRS